MAAKAWDKVFGHLDEETGLRCVPRFVRRRIRKMFEGMLTRPERAPGQKLPPLDAYAASYLSERLDPLIRVIEPLADTGPREFRDLCFEQIDVPDIDELGRRLGGQAAVKKGDDYYYYHMILAEDILNRGASPSAILYCATSYWMNPFFSTWWYWQGIKPNAVAQHDSIALDFISDRLKALGVDSAPILWWFEHWARFPPQARENPLRLSEALSRSRPTLIANPTYALKFMVKWCKTLALSAFSLRDRKRLDQARALLAEWVRLRPLENEDKHVRAEALKMLAFLTKLIGVGESQALAPQIQECIKANSETAPLRDGGATLLKDFGLGNNTTSVSLLCHFSEELGRLPEHEKDAVKRLEDHLGLLPDDYFDHKRLASALKRSLRHVEDNWHAAELIRLLATLLEGTPGRGVSDAIRLIECWLGITSDMYNEERQRDLRNALRTGPLGETKIPSSAARAVLYLVSALRRHRVDGPRIALQMMEVWLDIEVPLYADQAALAARLTNSQLNQITYFGSFKEDNAENIWSKDSRQNNLPNYLPSRGWIS